MKKVIVVGGVAGGASAIARLRRLNEDIQIILFEKGEHISFANCGLPYYIGETIKNKERLFIQTPDTINKRFNVDVRVNSKVIEIDTKIKKIKVKNQNNEIYQESYDDLILSPGARPIKPNLKGIDNKNIFTVRNITDSVKIKEKIDKEKIKNVVIIGGGFIGVEITENCVNRKLNTTLIEGSAHILSPFDSDMVPIIEKEIVEKGAKLLLNSKVKEFKDYNNQGNKEIVVILENNKRYLQIWLY